MLDAHLATGALEGDLSPFAEIRGRNDDSEPVVACFETTEDFDAPIRAPAVDDDQLALGRQHVE